MLSTKDVLYRPNVSYLDRCVNYYVSCFSPSYWSSAVRTGRAEIAALGRKKIAVLLAIFSSFNPVSLSGAAFAQKVKLISPARGTLEKIKLFASRFTERINLGCLRSTTASSACLITDPLLQPEPTVINLPRIFNSTCPLKEYASQANQYLPLTEQLTTGLDFQSSPGINKIINIGLLCPISEEFLFRDLIQKKLLKEGSRSLLQKHCPQHEKIVDSLAGKISRVVLTSALFAAIHLPNATLLSIETEALQEQMANAFVFGLFTGTVVEMEPGPLGMALVITMHIAHNFIGLSDECNI